MRERKDVGGDEIEVVPPERNGKKATVVLQLEVMIEVSESDDWNDMVNQAKDKVNERVVEGKGFFPYYSRCKMLHLDTEVEHFKHNTYVEDRGKW